LRVVPCVADETPSARFWGSIPSKAGPQKLPLEEIYMLTGIRFVARHRFLRGDTDSAWRYYGAVDPYFGVLTNERFTKENLDEAGKHLFFESGERHVDGVLEKVRDCLNPSFHPKRAVDFGCGVGRLTVPLARVCDSVVGVDVSPAMLEEARRNAENAGLTNVELVEADDSLSRLRGNFDFIHSFIVFQHIPPGRGEAILVELVERLDEGGIGTLHFTYADSSTKPPPVLRRLRTQAYALPLVYRIRNILKREPRNRPPLQMNYYNLNRLLRVLQEHGCHEVHVNFTETYNHRWPIYGVSLYFLKQQRDLSEY
jgi:2-polyprenyl-3-methyl-5-hydroxy-6-metoxy-1,4-benzoquinol methylase